MLASHSACHNGVPLAAEHDAPAPLSERAAMACIVAPSLLCWAAIVLPLWAAS